MNLAGPQIVVAEHYLIDADFCVTMRMPFDLLAKELVSKIVRHRCNYSLLSSAESTFFH